MAFHIWDSETEALVRELARRRQIGLSAAIKLAVEHELERDAEAETLPKRIAHLRAQVLSRSCTGLVADKAFFDDLNGMN